MAALDFPTATAAGQTFEADTGVIYVYVGTPPNGFWSANSTVTGQAALDARYVQVAGDTMTGNLVNNARILIGTTSEGAANADNLTVADSGDSGITIRSGDSNEGSLFFSDATTGTGEYSGYVKYDHANNNLTLGTSNFDQLQIDSSGNVGIGTMNPTSLGSGFKEVIISGDTEGAGLQLEDTNGNVKAGFFTSDISAFAALRTITDHPLTFRTNNIERLRIGNSGNVGIGTTSPDHGKLTLFDSASASFNALVIQQGNTGSTASDGLHIGIDSAVDAYITHKENSALSFGTSNTEQMRIDSSGNVGIGTDAPNKKLEIRGALNGSDGVRINELSDTYHDLLVSGGNFYIHADSRGDNGSNNVLRFGVGSGGERMRIDSAGNVGIGETSPNHELHIKAISPTIQLESNGNFGDIAQVIFRGKDSGGTARNMASIGGLGTGSNVGALLFEVRQSGALTEAARIDASRRLLIGTTSSVVNDTRAKLQIVNGNEPVHLVLARNDNTIGTDSTLGSIRIFGNDSGGTYEECARISAIPDGNHALGDKPTRLGFYTSADNSAIPEERLRIGANGNVGIGTQNPSDRLHVYHPTSNGVALIESGDANAQIHFKDPSTSSAGSVFLGAAGNDMKFGTNTTERMRIDSNGNVGFGLTSMSNISGYTQLFIYGQGNGGLIEFGSNGTNIGRIVSNTVEMTMRTAGRLVFDVNGSTEAARIDSSGNFMVGKSAISGAVQGCELRENGFGAFTRSSGPPLQVRRLTNDGELVAFYQGSGKEGNISVSGSTVSYNGGHLTRWSQLPGNAIRVAIYRGTVLSNIDEMCEWTDENNEQLNRMKISDIEGDRNVSGVFQSWDEDDDEYTDDFYCAMTGDFVIRIGKDATVERGDLLMSAGDGTAKPQEDDVIRSKTIAKVTSTHVSETYNDGSYCVPCVLMAC